MPHPFFPLLMSTIFAIHTEASLGDKNGAFQGCVHQRILDRDCMSPTGNDRFPWNYLLPVLRFDEFSLCSLPLHLKLLRWTCHENCQYECMHEHAIQQRENSLRQLQYFGKWPHTRVVGIQEPASVVFSIANLIPNLQGALQLLAMSHVPVLKPSSHTQQLPSWKPCDADRLLWLMNAAVSVNTWFWSTIFHIRDLRITELLDYHCGGFGVFVSFFTVVVRTARLGVRTSCLLACVLLFCFTHHTSRMLAKMDYGYHNIVVAFVMTAQSVVWLNWSFSEGKGRGRPYTWKLLLFHACLAPAVLLEFLDFPPFMGVFDAHALWHAATAPLNCLYFSFLLDDLQWERNAAAHDHIL